MASELGTKFSPDFGPSFINQTSFQMVEQVMWLSSFETKPEKVKNFGVG